MIRSIRPASMPRAVAVAVLAPAVATGAGLLLGKPSAVAPASMYLLAVVIAAVLGRRWSGPAAAILSYLGLNFFFTPPRHTLRVETLEDNVALLVFLAVSLIVGALVARVWREQARALRRERETLLLNTLTNGLLTAQPLEQVLGELARGLVETFELATCEFRIEAEEGVIRVIEPETAGGPVGSKLEIPLSAQATSLGTLTVVRREGGFGEGDRARFAAFARQILLGLERTRLDAEVRRARLDAESNQMRAALFSSVTHDLRTPLASIKAAVSSLLQEGVEYNDEQRADLLQTVLEETDRLNRLVGNILDLARVRAGAMVPAKEPTHIEDVIEAVLARMQPELRRFTVRTVIRPDLPALQMDPMQIDQVLSNLVENAVRFSPDGGEILISAGMWQSAVQVRVADQGPGIPPEDRERVFEPFFRRDGDRDGGGTGLGLPISKAIVSAHGGRIWVEGAPGGGTAVVLELPSDGDRVKA